MRISCGVAAAANPAVRGPVSENGAFGGLVPSLTLPLSLFPFLVVVVISSPN